jgi:hypothetical protein
MKYQDRVICLIEDAGRDLFRNARAMPEDKLEWKPSETARTALDQIQECAYTPLIFIPILVNRASEPFDMAKFEEMRAIRRQWTTIDECERVFWENTNKLFDVIRQVPDTDLDVQVQMPWGSSEPLATVLLIHFWNLVYHQGQISYIQTIYGDREMH